jgi:16S rRNA (uracil1498-N3)-methyltransferase
MILHYCENIDEEYTFLNEEESQHITKVLRKKNGDKLNIINGKGFFCEAEIVQEHQKHCKIKIISKEKKENSRDYKIHIAIAPTKSIDRFEWFIEKAVEIGIDEITPIITFHSERRVIKEDRIKKIILSAIKQSHEFYMPVLNKISSFENFIKQQYIENKYIAHCYKDPKVLLSKEYVKNNDAIILIGPEGDFSELEVKLAISSGYKSISLGTSRLRTETAGIVACCTISVLNQ